MKPLSKNANITWKINTKTINNTKVYGVKQMIAILLIITACVLICGDDDRKDGIIVLILTILCIAIQLADTLVKI